MGKTEANKIIKQLENYQGRVTQTPQAALRALRNAGLVTKSGNPTKAYRPASSSKSKG